jgi:LuxR family maltose regulon positive regulatory protein
LTELRSAELRFTPDEAAAFLNTLMGLDLTPEDVGALEARTEGWIVGLQMAALSLQGRTDARAFISAFTGGHHYVLEYLTEEVVRRQPEPVQRFLVQTSILERLCAPLCEVVLKEDSGVSGSDHEPLTPNRAEDMLEHLHRRNLFIVSLDDERRWYRYHHLFADLLRNILRRESAPQQIRALHRRASRWYAENGKVNDAIRHALGAQDFERAAALIEGEIKTTLSRGSVTTLLRWAEALPEEILGAHPRLRMVQGWALFLNGQLPLANPIFHDLKAALQALPPTAENDALHGELAAMLATISVVLQDIPQALAEAREALARLPADDPISRARATRALGVAYGVIGDTDRAVQNCSAAKPLALAAGNRFLAAEIISQLASLQIHQGRLREAARSYQEIVELVDPPSRFPPAGLGFIGLADVSLEWNELQTVEDLLNQGIELCQRGGIGYGLRPAYCTRAILRQAQGDTEGALQAIRQAEQFDPAVPLLERAIHLAWHQVRLWLLLGDVETAYRWATGQDVIPNLSFEDLPILLYELQQVALARVCLARGEPEKVLAIADRLRAPAKAGGRIARVIELSLLEALALQAQGKLDAAHAPFARCLVLAEPGGYVRLFLEAGPPVVTLLREAAARGISPEYVEKLLAAFDVPGREKALVPGSHVPDLVEPLTRRELEVLGLIGAGFSNQQIADELVLALNTVKRHTSNIYAKLDVRSRAQAILRAQELGLL